MSKTFHSEREGQIEFFDRFGITDTELSNNTDGIYNGNIFEFKLTINNFNTALFQALKYLNHMRIKGVSIPANILLVSLNQETAYLFKTADFSDKYINRPPFVGAASKDNDEFSTFIKPEVIKYDKPTGIKRISEILITKNYVRITIDIFDVVGWANRFYNENPKATKSHFFEEIRIPKHFKEFIVPWGGEEKDFKYIMDLLNDKMHRKELGAFYTPPVYCKKATELVREAISRIPKENDYIILDRSAGTGNLEEFLTDRPVNDITVGELRKYLPDDLVDRYISDKKNIFPLIDFHDLNSVTIGELESYSTSINIKDYIFDNELSHTIVNTYELKEWIVLNERIGDKVMMIIPPEKEVTAASALVNGGDALSEQFIVGKKPSGFSKDYKLAIRKINNIISDGHTNIILFENPPFRDSSAANTDNLKNKSSKGSFVFENMKQELESLPNTNISTARDISNQFIWSGWKYYLTKPDDYFVLFGPVKYWKSLGLSDKKFIKGFLFNRWFFHASPSAISCILWKNQEEKVDSISLQAVDINTQESVDNNFVSLIYLKNIEIQKVYSTLNPYYEKRTFYDDQSNGIYLDPSGFEVHRRTSTTSITNSNIVGYMFAGGYSVDAKHIALVRTTIFNGRGFYLRSDNFIEKLPLFAAKLFSQKNWFERDVYFTTADGGNNFLKDEEFLKSCLLYTCLSQRNHCCSLRGSDGHFYKNELCLEQNTVASEKLKEYSLTSEESALIDTFKELLLKAKSTKNYSQSFTYGPYQINQELNTRKKDENDKWEYDYPGLNTDLNTLKVKLSKYYDTAILPKLFKHELLK